MENIVIIIVIALVIGGAIMYIRKERKKGIKCIGCPMAAECAKRQSGESCKRN